MSKRAKPVGILTTVGAISTGEYYAVGGSSGISAIKAHDFHEYTEAVRSKIGSTFANHVKVNAPLVAGIAMNALLKRRNPGITVGGWRIKLF